jgi:hypothetical protein
MKVFKSAIYRPEKKVEKAARSGMYTVRNVRSATNDYFETPERVSKKVGSASDKPKSGG